MAATPKFNSLLHPPLPTVFWAPESDVWSWPTVTGLFGIISSVGAIGECLKPTVLSNSYISAPPVLGTLAVLFTSTANSTYYRWGHLVVILKQHSRRRVPEVPRPLFTSPREYRNSPQYQAFNGIIFHVFPCPDGVEASFCHLHYMARASMRCCSVSVIFCFGPKWRTRVLKQQPTVSNVLRLELCQSMD